MRNQLHQAILSTLWKTRRFCPLGLLCLTLSLTARSQVIQIQCHERPASGTDTPDTLYYGSDRPLTWSDFKGTPLPTSTSAAITFAGFNMDVRSKLQKDSLLIDIYLQAYFDKRGSWYKPGEVTAYSLSHEQLHFILAKLWELKFRAYLDTLQTDTSYYSFDIQHAYLTYYRHFTSEELEFDQDTHHGLLPDQEAKWQVKIHETLRQYETTYSPEP